MAGEIQSSGNCKLTSKQQKFLNRKFMKPGWLERQMKQAAEAVDELPDWMKGETAVPIIPQTMDQAIAAKAQAEEQIKKIKGRIGKLREQERKWKKHHKEALERIAYIAENI